MNSDLLKNIEFFFPMALRKINFLMKKSCYPLFCITGLNFSKLIFSACRLVIARSQELGHGRAQKSTYIIVLPQRRGIERFARTKTGVGI